MNLLCLDSQEHLLDELDVIFTEEDNNKLLKLPDKTEVKAVLQNSYLHAAPSTYGITIYLYYKLFNFLGDSLTEVVKQFFALSSQTQSQNKSIMVYINKPKKKNSILVKDKRKISLLKL